MILFLNFVFLARHLGVGDNADRFEYGIAKVKDEKSQHEGYCITAVDKNIGDHHA